MAYVHDIIIDTLEILRTNINIALNDLRETAGEDHIFLGNVARADDGNPNLTSTLEDTVILSLFKVEEEFGLKNKPARRRNPETGRPEYVNSPAYLNLHVLITATNTSYTNALENLSFVIGYLRHKTVFTNNDDELTLPGGMDPLRFNFNLNMITLSYEQLNHIWGILGGKHYPCVMYKVQLIEIHYEPDVFETGEVIRQITVNEKIY